MHVPLSEGALRPCYVPANDEVCGPKFLPDGNVLDGLAGPAIFMEPLQAHFL